MEHHTSGEAQSLATESPHLDSALPQPHYFPPLQLLTVHASNSHLQDACSQGSSETAELIIKPPLSPSQERAAFTSFKSAVLMIQQQGSFNSINPFLGSFQLAPAHEEEGGVKQH